MREDAEDDFTLLRFGTARRERGPEPALMAAEDTLRVPALVIERRREAPAHRATVGRRGPAPTTATPIELDDRLAHAQDLATESVIVLAVVARVREHEIDREQRGRLLHRRRIAGAKSGESCDGPVPVTAPTIRWEPVSATAVSLGHTRRSCARYAWRAAASPRRT